MKRREALFALAGLGGVGLVGFMLVDRETIPVESDDENTTVHSPDPPAAGHDDDTTREEPPDEDEGGQGGGVAGIPSLPGAGGANNPTSLEIDLEDHGLDRFNAGAMSFAHDVFLVCNRHEVPVDIWVDADPVANARGDPSVVFYRGDRLEDRIDDPDNAATLASEECLSVGIQTNTDGIRGQTDLLEEIRIRTTGR